MPDRTAALSAEFKYRILLDVSRKINRTFELTPTLAQLLDALRSAVQYDAAGIFVLNTDVPTGGDEGFLIAGMATVGFDPRPRPSDEMRRFGRGIVGHVIATGQTVMAPDVRDDPRYVEGRPTTRSEVAVPISSHDRVIGALNLESDRVDAFSAADLQLLEFFATAAALAIEKAMAHRDAVEKQRMAQQLRLAREVQANLLPAVSPRLEGYDAAAINIPTWDIGGDYYDYIPLGDGRLGLVIADVAGKGIPAALVMTSFRTALRGELRRDPTPPRVMGELHQTVRELAGDSGFVTAVYGILEPRTGTFTYVNAGHNPPLLLRSDGGRVLLAQGGPALGMVGTADFQAGAVTIGRGDCLALYTDAVVELTDPDDRDFTLDRLATVLEMDRQRTAADTVKSVVAETRAFARREAYDDDFTLVVVRRLE